VIVGTTGADTINALDGDDLVCGAPDGATVDGADTINAGDGSDFVLGVLGNDVINGGNGDDFAAGMLSLKEQRGAAGVGGPRASRIVVLHVRLGRRELVDDDVVLGPLHGGLELRRLVPGLHQEAVVLLPDRLVDANGHGQPLAAASLGAALAEDVDRALDRPRLGRLAELRDAVVHLAEERLVPRLADVSVVQSLHTRVFSASRARRRGVGRLGMK
jgi:RTX calcium-binding nonapeptide repeat (4 copies)